MQKPHNNQELFSNYYLEERLGDRDSWQNPEGLEEVYEEISELYEERKDILDATKEAQTEEEWIKPILHTLGFKYIPQPSQEIFDTTKEPDYAFFLNDEEKDRAYQAAKEDKRRLFDFALAVGDAKRWDLNLNNLRPNKQIDEYLRITDSKWGLLTNGRLWRIYHLDSSYRLDTYYEVDLVELIEAEDKEKFKYFYLFFHPRAFVEDGFLTEVYEQSEDYTASVSEDLKENAFDALQELCQGFLSGNPDLGEEDLDDIYKNSLVLLYRLIFLLYAESDEEENLLPMDNKEYRTKYSLKALKQDAVKDTIDGDSLHSSFSLYWAHLKGLFSVIDNGEDTLGVYAYNGGLFDKERHPFIDEEHSIGDKYLAEAIRKVSYSEAEGGFIDYQDLDVRELGAIYEGLLEHKPVIDGEQVKWEEDLSERKKTGSYYTPEYIVKYIVENTIGPLVEEKKEELNDEIEELEQKKKGSQGYDREVYEKKLKEKRAQAREEILDLKVLDPAMGSGHFLVEATEKLANEIAALEEEFSAENDDDEHTITETDQDDPVKELKRQIVERSIYGVDKNPLATELAKLSLWLHTVAKNEPLSFLDHHLRTGDSLIGIDIEKMKTMPSEREQMAGLFTSNLVKDLGNAIGHLNLIEEITSGSRDDVQEKKTEWRDVKSWIDKYKKAANVRLSTSFGNEVSDDEYRKVLQAAANNNMESIKDEKFFHKAQEIAKNKSFFHWELEFPDVFRDDRGKKKNESGFDVVIGNPPWVRVHKLNKTIKAYLKSEYKSIYGQEDLYTAFTAQSFRLLRSEGYFSFINPKFILFNLDTEKIRNMLLERQIVALIDSGEAFEQVSSETLIEIIRNSKDSGKNSISVQLWREGGQVRDEYELDQSKIELFPNNIINIYCQEKDLNILQKIQKVESRFGDYYSIKRGGEISKKQLKNNEGNLPAYLGYEINRYYAEDPKGSIEEENKEFKRLKKYSNSKKILVRRVADRLICALDPKQAFFSKNNYGCLLKDSSTSPHKDIAILNSSLSTYFFKKYFSTKKENLFPEIQQYQLEMIPLPVSTYDQGKTLSGSDKDELEKLSYKISELKDSYQQINLDLLDYFGHFDQGKTLSEIYSPAKGLSNTLLTSTTRDKTKLHIHSSRLTRKGNKLQLEISARYKPNKVDIEKKETDQWGYLNTGFTPAMQFTVSENMEELIQEFVPLAIDKDSGFANFRKNATKTISLIERLEKLTLPKLEDVESGLQKYLEQREKAEKLEKEIQEIDHQIDAIVFDLYELEENEAKTVLDSLETPEDEKTDILSKFKKLRG